MLERFSYEGSYYGLRFRSIPALLTLGNLVAVTLNEQRLLLDCLNEAAPPPFFRVHLERSRRRNGRWNGKRKPADGTSEREDSRGERGREREEGRTREEERESEPPTKSGCWVDRVTSPTKWIFYALARVRAFTTRPRERAALSLTVSFRDWTAR